MAHLQQPQPLSPTGEVYGFGAQFHQHAQQFYAPDGSVITLPPQQQMQQLTGEQQMQQQQMASSHDQVTTSPLLS